MISGALADVCRWSLALGLPEYALMTYILSSTYVHEPEAPRKYRMNNFTVNLLYYLSCSHKLLCGVNL